MASLEAGRNDPPGYRNQPNFSQYRLVEALELLKSHPYILTRAQLAFARATLCEELKRYHAAARFHAQAIAFEPENPKLPFVATA